jgi:hypothetical protein
MFIAPSVWMIPVDTSDEWHKTEIWGRAKGFYAVPLFLLIEIT